MDTDLRGDLHQRFSPIISLLHPRTSTTKITMVKSSMILLGETKYRLSSKSVLMLGEGTVNAIVTTTRKNATGMMVTAAPTLVKSTVMRYMRMEL